MRSTSTVARGFAAVALGVVLLAAGAAAGKIPVRPAAASQTVVVPRIVRGVGVVGAYARLRAAGLRVSIPRGLRFDSLKPPTVARSAPAAGRRVARDSVVTLYLSCCARVRSLRAPVGRLPRFAVPKFARGTVSAASAWAAKHKLDFKALLGPLNAGAEAELFANYRVSGQRPAAGVRIAVGKRTRVGNGKPGRFQRTTVTVWGTQPPPCTPPAGSTVVAGSTEAVITSHTYTDSYADGPLFAWYGCLRTVGEWRFLAGSETGGYSGMLEVQQVRLEGRFAAFLFLDTYSKNTGCEYDVGIYDLNTAKPGNVFHRECSYPPTRPLIDTLLLSSKGFAAWHTTDNASPTALTGMSCPSVSFCVATDTAGNVLTTTSPTGGRQAWSVAHIAGGALQGVSCPAANLCVAVGDANIYVSTDPTGGGAAWAVTATTTAGLAAVACPSRNLCVAGGSSTVITSTNPTGGAAAWVTAQIPAVGQIHAISCPSTVLCVMGGAPPGLGGALVTSTNPAGGASAWSVATYPMIGDISDVSCPSTNLCVAVSATEDMLTSTNPTGGATAWTVATPPIGPSQAISCPSTNLCVAGVANGILATSTNPASGPSAWTGTLIPVTGAVEASSCPTTTLCVAGDNAGDILTSTNPAGGSSAWSATLIDAPFCNDTLCEVEHLYVYDAQGTQVLDTSPPAEGNAITGIQLSGDQIVWTDDGSYHQATLH
jgi:hypothetical protein